MIFGTLIEDILQLVLHNTIALIEEVVYVKLNYLFIINFTKKKIGLGEKWQNKG